MTLILFSFSVFITPRYLSITTVADLEKSSLTDLNSKPAKGLDTPKTAAFFHVGER